MVINNGQVDRDGGFVFGTRSAAKGKHVDGAIYQFTHKHGLRELVLPVPMAPTAICFSADGRTMYFSDANAHQIYRCNYDAEGAQVSKLDRFAQTVFNDMYVRDAFVDAEENLWTLQDNEVTSGGIVQYTALGRVRRTMRPPQIAVATFVAAGANLSQLYFIDRRGFVRIFTDVQVCGLPESRFNDQGAIEECSSIANLADQNAAQFIGQYD